MTVDSTRIARPRRLAISPAAFARIALASAVSLYVIVVSGATVRVTASGLGCEAWPGCAEGAFFPEQDLHGTIEFGNRIVALLPLTLSLVAWIAARRAERLPRWAPWLALTIFAGTLVQAPLGRLTVVLDLHPLMVMLHFLLALAVLAGAVVLALEGWSAHRGRAEAPVRPEARRLGLVLGGSCLALVLSGAFSTAAGPHSGGADVERYGLLVDTLYVHVRSAGIFAVLLAGLTAYLWTRRDPAPGLFALSACVLGLAVVQGVVGEVQWRTQLPWWLVLMHVALAAALWAGTVALVATLHRPPAALVREPT